MILFLSGETMSPHGVLGFGQPDPEAEWR
jgi:hypothetical protein